MAETVVRFTPSARAGLPPGTRLSDIYELETMIGAGGMGEVYRGRQIETGDPVAIKMIKSDLAGEEAIFALFRKEASALHSLHHDSIVRYFVFSIDRRLNRPYLAMEYVDGPSLSDRVSKSPLRHDQAAILRQRIASGLQVAHDKGIIHRDLSSDNIILPGGDIAAAKIIDFGIARTGGLGGGTTLIGDGFAGKYNYASPEQLGLFGGNVTNRSDIYSLGLVLAEAMLGKPLDMSGSQADVVIKRQKLPDLSGIDARLRPLLVRMLQPDPKDRIGSMSEVAAWVERRPLPIGRIAMAVAATVVLGGAGASAYFFLESSASIPHQVAQVGSETRQAAAVKPDPLPSAAVAPPPPAAVTDPAPPTAPPALSHEVAAAPAPSPPSAPASTQSTSAATSASTVLTAADRVARMYRYVRYFDGGPCFYASPAELTDRSAAIDVFASSDEQIRHFAADFRMVNGIDARISAAKISPPQCPAMAFLQRLDPDPRGDIRLKVRQETVRSGQPVTGQLEGMGERPITLLTIGDTGRLKVLSPRRERGGAPIDLRLDDEDNSVSGSKLLIALATSRPLASAAKVTGKAVAWDALPALLEEATAKEGDAGPPLAAVKLVRFEK